MRLSILGEENLKSGANRMHWDPILKYAIPDLDRRKGEDRTGRCTSTDTSSGAYVDTGKDKTW